MAQAQSGDIVRVHYRGTLSDGTEFDSSRGREPLEFQVGSGQVIPGFERQVEGMAVGETSVVTIPADEAYGQRDERQIQEIPRNAMPEDLILEVGAGLTATTRDGKEIPLTVVALTDDTVTVDGNHPLAGRDLTFELELVEIVASPNKSGFGV
ncbi:peptidyl-prolyl cis-trans isomerase [Nitratireductor aestuarii]|uniref:Peptidyl-prolyl cis-trans isomerase n=1 Tax=Nitratireductor aestuarii TaxID=1735103 RepID=A0A916RU04_9HYPH|nr:peptidylprolyl isomerase [Nitratireductor aestuarii]GGA70258.1 peptidyl-prolyl cis-trans isomerase [Nitratireductor aestuarii]